MYMEFLSWYARTFGSMVRAGAGNGDMRTCIVVHYHGRKCAMRHASCIGKCVKAAVLCDSPPSSFYTGKRAPCGGMQSRKRQAAVYEPAPGTQLAMANGIARCLLISNHSKLAMVQVLACDMSCLTVHNYSGYTSCTMDVSVVRVRCFSSLVVSDMRTRRASRMRDPSMK